MTWVNDNKKKYIKAFFEYFHDIYDEYLVKIVECKKIEEYTEVERKLMGPDPLSKPGKIPTRLNKPTTKVLAVYYFISLFLIKRAGQGLNLLLEGIIYRARVAALNYEQIKKENAEILDNFEKLEKRVGDSDLTSGLLIADLENRIRNLEADVIAKERIILEKNEANNILWEKIKVLEEKEELPTSNSTNMDLEEQPTRQEFLLKKENDCIDENGDIQELNRRPPWRRRLNDFIDDNRYIREYSRGTNNWNRASRPSRQEYNRGTNNRYRDSRTYDSRMEWEQQRDEYTHSALLRMNKQWR
ncbi:7564_t:CDS:2 [Rhizophagus irregularis]|nr:7564_t:CDS:2 [Rhizophagus irregularis]